ncbi:MAG: SAM-dependent methyltransferase [Streptosporangiaceae bacterium]
MPDRRHLAAVNATQPHIARVYDYLLGGKDHFAADRAVADRIIASMPAVQVGVRAQRDLLGRVVRYLVGEAGIKQLLDIGSGLPTAENVHQIAQRIAPTAKVVYVDNDPMSTLAYSVTPGHGSIPGGLSFISLRLLAKPASPSVGAAGL